MSKASFGLVQLLFLQYHPLKAGKCRVRGSEYRVAFDLNSRHKNNKALLWCEGEVCRMMVIMDMVRKYCSRETENKGLVVKE